MVGGRGDAGLLTSEGDAALAIFGAPIEGQRSRHHRGQPTAAVVAAMGVDVDSGRPGTTAPRPAPVDPRPRRASQRGRR